MNSRKEKNEVRMPSVFGFTLLLVVFLTLAFFAFAAISLTTARNDYNTSRSLAEHRTEYADAANTAEEMLANYNTEALEKGGIPEQDIAFDVTINDTSRLSVRCRWNEESRTYQTVEWKTVSAKKWESGTTLPVWQ